MVRQRNREKIVCFLTFAALMLSISISVPVHAQVAGGTFTGTITDSSGAAVPNAQVIIKNTATGITTTTTTTSAGLYTAPNLLPGTYDITASAPGFSTAVQSGVRLTVGSTQELNLPLSVGQVTEKVEVTAEAPTVQLTSSSISATVNATEVRELPLNGRDWTQLATLQPGVTSLGSIQKNNNGRSAGGANNGFGNGLSISGGRPGQNNYRVDGVSINDSANDSPGSVLGGTFGVDAIQEFSVVTSNYSAEYGRTSGGVINAVTRSGTNGFHGDVYEFLRNSALDARNFFDGPKIPPFKRNQFGAAAGGPIRKDKTFFFGDYEGQRQSLGISFVDQVPSLDARKGLLHNTDGTTTDLSANPNFLLVKPFLPLWPSPTGAILGVGNSAIALVAPVQIASENFVTGRIDHKFSDKDSLAGTYQWDHSNAFAPDALVTANYVNYTARQLVALDETHIFSPQLVNSVRVGYNRSVASGGYISGAINPLAGNPALGTFSGMDSASIGVSGLTSFAGGVTFPNAMVFVFNSFQGYDDGFLTKGIHTLKFGFAVERMQTNINQNQQVPGAFTFGSIPNFLNNIPATFFSESPSKIASGGLRQTILGGYFQDDVRWRSNLTLNLGIRYEMATTPTEAHGKLVNMRGLTDTVASLGDPLFLNPTYRNFEPRLGFAWDPFRNGKTSVRGGFGIFDVLPLLFEYDITALNGAPYALQVKVPGAPPQGSFPVIAGTLVSSSAGKLREPAIEYHPKRNYIMQWNFTVQRQLRSDLTVTVGYLGSSGVHNLFTVNDMNMVTPTKTPAGYLWPDPATSLPQNPNFGRMLMNFWSGKSTYHALEAQVIKNLSHGFQIQGSYTFSKSIDQGDGAATVDPYASSLAEMFWFDMSLNRGLADFNVKHNLVINYNWTIPTPNSLHGAAGWALGGWEVGGIIGARTGVPFTPLIGGDPLGLKTATTYSIPNRLKGPGCETGVNPGSPTNYLKTQCFTFPNPSTLLGNAGRNSLIGPGAVTVDFSLFKNMPVQRISESFKAQFRAEVFNIINHANFNNPTASTSNALFNSSGQLNPNAGILPGTSTFSRQIQFGLKVIW